MSANFLIFFCKPSKIKGLQTSKLYKIITFSRFDTNFFLFWCHVHRHTIQLCYLVFNPCPIVQMVIHFHGHIKMGVSHDVLQYLNVHTALCHSCTGCVSHNMSGNLWKPNTILITKYSRNIILNSMPCIQGNILSVQDSLYI